MPLNLLVDLIVKALQAMPQLLDAINTTKDLTVQERTELKKRISDAQAGVPEWK